MKYEWLQVIGGLLVGVGLILWLCGSVGKQDASWNPDAYENEVVEYPQENGESLFYIELKGYSGKSDPPFIIKWNGMYWALVMNSEGKILRKAD